MAPGQEVWLNWQIVKLGSTGPSIAAIDNVRVGNFGGGNPSILAQPMPQSIILSNNATISVTASGSMALGYQWRRNGTNIAASNNATATTSALTISNAQPTDVGSYDVVVTSGATSITSAAVPVQVYTRGGVIGAATNNLVAAPALTNYTVNTNFFDIAVANTSAYTNKFDLYLPSGPAPSSGRPAVVVIHGGGGNDGDKADGREVQASQEFASHGYVALSINYKRSFQTKSSGNWTTAWPQNIKDAKTAVRWLRANAATYGIDPNRIGAIGFSWGGNEASMLALTDGDAALDPAAEDGLGVQSTKVSCAANFYGAVQIPDYHNMNQFGGNGVPGSVGTMDHPTNNYLLASPASRASATAAPMLLHFGDADLEVMPTQNEALRSALNNAGAKTVSVIVPGGKHSYSLYETDSAQGGSTNNPIDVRPHTIGFYDSYLLPRAPSVTSTTNLTFAKGAPFTTKVAASHVPTLFAATNLPVGWTIDSSTGQISGTMPSSGSQTVTVFATGTSGTAVSTLTFTASESITVASSVVGTTPALLGYNLGHFTDKGDGFDWFRYSGVKGARVFMSASELQSQTSPGRAVVTSEAAFWDTINKTRSLGTSKSTYIRWSDFNYDYTSTSGNNDITFKYAFTQLKSLGVDILVNITASPGTFPIISATDWAGKWELWQHFYAQAYLLARDYDIRRFSMFNEPNNWTGMTEPDWFQRLRICSDAIQKAIADVNAARGKSLVPRIYAPNTANGKEKYNTSTDTWGRDTIVNRYLQLNGLNSSSWSPITNSVSAPWRLSQVYNYQKYSMLTDDDSGLTGFNTDINALKGLIAADLGGEALPPLALTEYNVRPGSSYDTKTENQDTPSDYIALAANSVGLAANGADELFLFKFGQTDSGGVNYGVAKNGTHYVENTGDNNYGGATKAAEVYRLFNKAAQGGRQRYAFSTSSNAVSTTTSGLWTLVTRDPATGNFYVFLANKRTSSIPLELDLSALNIPDGNPVMLEDVATTSSGDASPIGNVVNGRVAIGSIPRETIWLVTIPSTGAGLSSIFATEDTQLTDGAGRSLLGTLVNPMLARADGTANGRSLALIKIPVSAGDLTNNRAFYLDMEVASSSATNAAQAHVYGVNDVSWAEDSATWANQTAFLRQNVGSGSQIANNVVLNAGGTPPARMLGQIIATTNAPSRTAVDVTEFVKSRTNGFASFVVVQDHRWDFSADPVTNRVTGDIQPAGVLITSRDKDGSGPRLLAVSANASTNAPVVLNNPVDRYLDVGGSTTLSVSVDQSLPCTIQWMKDGVAIAGANGTTLTLSNVSVGDAGIYTAEVTNANGTTVSAGATVAINASPVLVRPLGDVVATAGDPVILSADFSGYPPPSFVWRKNSVVIPGATGSSYSFIAAADSAGTYSITADNGLGTASSSATLTLEAAATGFLPITSTNASVTEDFDTLGKSTSVGIRTSSYLAWTNGVGWMGPSSTWYAKPGWYAATDDNRSPFEGSRTLNNGNSDPSTPPARSESGLASMGSSSGSNDRGLGGLPWTNNRVFFGVRLRNNTGVPLQGFSVRYRMEQFSATTAAKSGTKLYMASAVNPISLRSTNFFNFGTNSPIVTNNNSYGRKDGTSGSNSGMRTNQVGGLNIAPGDSVWVRWEVSTTTAEALAFAIDDL
ncbi:MAG: immunoglobulin domain-containing protein, partial [Sphaerospermopsis kisseleviana]